MSETGEQPREAGDGEAARISTLQQISDRLDALARRVEAMASGGGGHGPAEPGQRRPAGPTQAESAEQRRAEIREQLAELRSQEKAAEEHASVLDRLGKLEKAAERPPRQFRRIERAMGWVRE